MSEHLTRNNISILIKIIVQAVKRNTTETNKDLYGLTTFANQHTHVNCNTYAL